MARAGGLSLAVVNSYEHLSFDVGPTLASWLAAHAPDVLERMVDGDRVGGGAVAQAYNHATCGAATVVALLLLGAWVQLGSAGVVLVAGAALATVVVVLVAERRIERSSVGVSLDASRRWVTLTGVHPGFAAACRDRAEEGAVQR